MVTEADDEAVKPRESVQVAPIVIGPGEAPVVFKVPVFPLPEILPPLEVHPPTVTGTLSGLVQVQVMVDVSPALTVVRARRAGHLRWVLGWFLHGEIRGTTGRVVLLGLGIGDGGGDRRGIAAGCTTADAVGVDGGVGVLTVNFAATARPGIGERVLGIEVAGDDGGVHRLADHDVGGLHRASG